MEGTTNGVQSPDDFRILISTDNHLGYLENDPVRGDDSFIAFEEVLSLAVEYDVDLILLGGDLFHHAKPSPNCMLQCTKLIRKYCFGDKPVAIEILSDQEENFSRNINYEDPNLNVSYPILSIHGNHDDPVGQGAISSLDILSSMGLVNYFGKWNDYTEVRVSPVLLRKGNTRLALYGLSHLKDQRLARLFKEHKVSMECPPDGEDWFNLLVLHQNRADRGPDNYIPESALPTFLDLVVWGHEHDCRIVKEYNGKFHVTQPGSTVATSLAAGEALPKHCAILQIPSTTNGEKFMLKPIPLRSVRPFIFRTIVLSEENLGEAAVNESDKVQEFLKKKLHEAVEESQTLRSNHPQQPLLPLVRLNVFYEHEGQDFNRVRFGQNFNGLVANPNDILMMKREKRLQDRKPDIGSEDNGDLERAIRDTDDTLDVATLLQEYYAAPQATRLGLLSARAMADAVRDFTVKNNDETFRRVFDAHRRHCVQYLMEASVDTEEEVAQSLLQCRESLDSMDADSLRAIMQAKPEPKSTPKQVKVVLSSDDEMETIPASKGRNTRSARGGNRGRGRGRGRSAAQAEPEPPSPMVERRTPRRSAAKAASASWLQDAVNTRSLRVDLHRLDVPIDIDDSD